MHLKNHKIVILHKKTQKTFKKDTKLINMLRQDWVDAGAEVEDLYGTDTFVPADLIIVHVDLSIVSDEYQIFAARYPRQINANILDIRKSKVCKHLLTKDDVYNKAVLVKTNLNFAGIPEQNDEINNRDEIRSMVPIHFIYRKLRGIKRRISKYPDIVSKDQ